MNREDPYRQKTESTRRRVGRVTIQEQVKSESLPPRSELHRERRAKKKKKINISWIRLQVAFFIFLPIIIFVIYSNREDLFPKTTKTTVTEEKGGYETISIDNENKESKTKEKGAKAASKEENSNRENETVKEEETKNQQPTITEPNDNESVPSNEQGDVTAQTQQSIPIEPAVEQPVEQSMLEHIVQPGETLYRIAMKYYHSKSGIEKIKQANHLTNENIRVGQKLKIPK